MKQFIIILITVVILGVLYFFQEDLQKLYYSLLRDFTEEQVSFDKKNEYYRDYDFMFVQTTEELSPTSYQDILNIVDVLYLGNIKGFSKLLLLMIETFYKWKKVILLTNPKTITTDEIELINLIESNSIDDVIYKISCNFDWIEIIVESFIFYETNDILFKEEIEDLYNKLVSEEIKIKLKEV